jgi:hypothetical protein
MRHGLDRTSTAPDGNAFTDFLTKLNDLVYGEAPHSTDGTGCFAGHCDWRLPNAAELRTILALMRQSHQG